MVRHRTDGYCFQLTVGITYVVVRHLLHSHLIFMELLDIPDRMLMFSMALFLYCWSISAHGSHIVIVSVSGVLFVFLWACVWTICEFSYTWAVWLGGLRVPSCIFLAPRALYLYFRDVAVSFCKRLLSSSTNAVGSEHELPDRGDGVVGGDTSDV
jgi:hypothetical protein